MNQCKCGSWAINHTCHGRDGSDGDLCDVCYWRKRAEGVAVPDLSPVIAWLENGCDPKEAAKELRIHQQRMRHNAK